MIRVAQILGKMNGGGVEQVVMNYYRFINRTRVQFDFVVEQGSLQVPFEEISRLGGRVFQVPPMKDLPSYERALRKLIREQRWQIVHSHLNALSVFPLHAAACEGVPVRIAHSHSSAGGVEPGRDLAKNVLRCFANTYPTHRFACSDYAGRWLFGGRASFEVVQNAIDVKRFAYNAEVRHEVRASLGISEQCLVVGHVGRFAVQKNHRFLIDVFERLQHDRNAVLILIGSGCLEKDVRSLVHQKHLDDSVLFLGFREDVERFYQAFDVFALPSHYEGLGIVNIEAQTAGLPCIVSDKVTRESDVSGNVVYLPADDPARWAKTIAGCAAFPRKTLREDAIQRRGFGIKTAASKLLQRYCELASQVDASRSHDE